MSRIARTLVTVVGSVALFALFAMVGWAVADRFVADESPTEQLEVVSLLEYPLNGAKEDTNPQFVAIGDEQGQTESALNGEIPAGSVPAEATGAQGAFGAASAGGQSVRVVAVSLTEVVDEATGNESPESETELVEEPDDAEELPAELFEDMPFLFGHLDLADIRIANPIPPLRIDICAGAGPLSVSPAGCVPGIGGTIVAIDLDPDPTLVGDVRRPSFGTSSGTCGTSDSETFYLPVVVSHPGTVHFKMWQGDRGSFAPLDAFSASFDVPADLAATLPAPEGSESDDFAKRFCVEVPAMSGTISAESHIVSSHPPVAGTLSVPWRWTVSARSGRPPTGLTAFGVDTLYVRTFRSSTETVWVKAIRIEPGESATSVCGTGGATFGGRGPMPGGDAEADVVAGLSHTIPMSIGPDWPYDEAFDTLEVRRLQLLPGERYAVCIYVVGGNRIAQSIVYSEASNVATPAARRMQVTVVGVGGNGETPNVPPGPLTVIPQVSGCRAVVVGYPGPTTHVQLESVVCGSETSGGAISSVLTNGGFAVTTHAVPVERDELRRFNERAEASGESERVWMCSLDERCVIKTNSWVSVARSDIVCTTECVDGIERVVRIPIRGFDMMPWFTDDEGHLVRERGFAPFAYADIKVKFISSSADPISRSWSINEPSEYEAVNSALPETMSVAFWDDTTRWVSDPATGWVSASTTATVFIDRPASIRAWIDPGSAVCAGEGISPQLEVIDDRLTSEHAVQFTGLCIGHFYTVGIEATDEDGARTSSAHRLTTAIDGTITIRAEITTGHPSHSLLFTDDIRHWQQYLPLQMSHVYPAERPVLSFDGSITGWIKGEGVYASRAYQCDGEGPPWGATWTYAEVPVHSLGWNLSTEVWRGEYYENDPTGVACDWDPSQVYRRVETLRLGATGLTLNELIQGVEISVPGRDGGEGATLLVRVTSY